MFSAVQNMLATAMPTPLMTTETASACISPEESRALVQVMGFGPGM